MSIVTIDRARQHCRSDFGDDTILSIYLKAAERRVASLANRAIFATAEERSTAIAAIPAAMVAANLAYDNALIAADLMADKRDRVLAKDVALAALNEATANATKTLNGIVKDDAIEAAVLICCGHFYRNRDEGDFPPAVENLMFTYRYLGNL